MSLDSKILQILDNSACLSKGQLSGYLSRSLYPEELRAVELHLSECPFCSDALDGFEQEQEAQKVLQGIEKIPALPPMVPRESKTEAVLDKVAKTVAPKNPVSKGQSDSHAVNGRDGLGGKNSINIGRDMGTKGSSSKRWLKPLGIAAGIFAISFLLWQFQFDKSSRKDFIADNRGSLAETASAETKKDSMIPAAVPSGPLAQNSIAAKKPLADTPATLKDKKAITNDTGKRNVALTAAKTVAEDGKGKQAALTPVAEAAAPQPETLRAARAVAAVNEKIKPQSRSGVPPEENDEQESQERKKTAAKQDDKMSDYEMGVELYKQKQYGSALLYLKPAQRNTDDPRHYDAVYYSALCYKSSGQKKKAIRLFKKLVEDGAPQKSSAQKQLKELGEE